MSKACETFVSFVLLGVGAVFGCASNSATEAAPGAAAAAPAATEKPPTRPTLTAQACEASGGRVVGDIGDGAIHRPDYRCPSGAAPSATIQAAEGGPIAVEGSVCCP